MGEGEKSKIIEGGDGQQIEKEKTRPLRIVFDFDETLVGRDHTDPLSAEFLKIRPGAEELITRLKEEDHTLILWTTATKEWLESAFDKSPIFRNAFSEIYTRDNPPELDKAKREDIEGRIKIAQDTYDKSQNYEDLEELDRLKQLKDLMLERNKVPSLIGADVLVDDDPRLQRDAGENVIEVPGYDAKKEYLRKELSKRLRDPDLGEKEKNDIQGNLIELEEDDRLNEDRCKDWEMSVMSAIHNLACAKTEKQE